MSLKSLLNTVEFNAVLNVDESKSHLKFSGDPNRLKNVFSWGRLNDALNSLVLPSSAVRLFKEGSALTYESPLDLIRETKAGATLIFDDLDLYDAELGRLLDGVTGDMGFPTRTNLYLSYPDTQGFFAHYDTHAFLILQISGKKSWSIYKNRANSPLYFQKDHQRITASDLELAEDVLLEEGDILFVPKGQWHDATAKEGPSVHLTLALFAPTGINFLNWIVDELRDDLGCRLDFPWGKSSLSQGKAEPDANLEASIQRVREALAHKFDDSRLGAQFLAYRAATMKVRNRLNFPHHILDSHEISNDSKFSLLAKTLSYFKAEKSNDLTLVGGEITIDVPECFEGALELITSARTFSFGELLAVSKECNQDDLKSLVSSLLTYGVVGYVEP